MSTSETTRRPRTFAADDPSLVKAPEPAPERPEVPPAGRPAATETEYRIPTAHDLQRGARWGALFVSAALALASLAAGLWFARFVSVALAREDWLGWLALGLASVLCLAGLMLVLRELVGLFRLRRLARLRRDADSALATSDKKAAASVVGRLKQAAADRPELAWGRARLAEHERDILTAGELLRLADRELVAPLDRTARQLVVQSASRVVKVTALSPMLLVSVGFVLIENLRMLRKLATLYGGQPGLAGSFRLAKLVVAHIIATGGVALTDDLFGQFLGQDLARRLSRRLGEGVFNGMLTARVGTAALDVCRPLPFLESDAPRLREVVAEVFKRDKAAAAAAGADKASKANG